MTPNCRVARKYALFDIKITSHESKPNKAMIGSKPDRISIKDAGGKLGLEG
jgi:hypothetical protein